MTEPARYRPGNLPAAVTSAGLVLFDEQVDATVLFDAWQTLRGGGDLDDLLQMLLQTFGFRALPGFAAVILNGERVHAAVRGGHKVRVGRTEGEVVLDAQGVSTWNERRLDAVTSVALGDVDAGSGDFVLGEGTTLVSALRVSRRRRGGFCPGARPCDPGRGPLGAGGDAGARALPSGQGREPDGRVQRDTRRATRPDRGPGRGVRLGACRAVRGCGRRAGPRRRGRAGLRPGPDRGRRPGIRGRRLRPRGHPDGAGRARGSRGCPGAPCRRPGRCARCGRARAHPLRAPCLQPRRIRPRRIRPRRIRPRRIQSRWTRGAFGSRAQAPTAVGADRFRYLYDDTIYGGSVEDAALRETDLEDSAPQAASPPVNGRESVAAEPESSDLAGSPQLAADEAPEPRAELQSSPPVEDPAPSHPELSAVFAPPQVEPEAPQPVDSPGFISMVPGISGPAAPPAGATAAGTVAPDSTALISAVPGPGAPAAAGSPERPAQAEPRGAEPAWDDFDGDHDGMTIAAEDLRQALHGTGYAMPSGPDSADSDAEFVLAVACPQGHVNPPHSNFCTECGNRFTEPARRMPRPSLGRLRVSTGEVVPLTGSVVVGRNPAATRVAGGRIPALLPVPSARKQISRSHVEIRLEGWNILGVDLNSSNGTMLRRPGQAAVRLNADPLPLQVGDVLELGDDVQVFIEADA